MSASPTGGLVLDVVRAPGETASLPVSVEATDVAPSPAGRRFALTASLIAGGACTVRAFQVRSLDVSLAAGTVATEMQGGRRFVVDAQTDVGRTTPLTLDATVDTAPSSFRAGIEAVPAGIRLAVNGNAPSGSSA